MLTVVALPGFTRQPRHLERFADACVEQGWRCVRPAIAPRLMPVLYMDTGHLDGVARRLVPGLGSSPVVVAGHSAGSAAGTYLAGRLLREGVDVRGLVMIDGVDSPNRLIARGLPGLAGLRVAAVLAPPSKCNRNGALGKYLADFPAVRVELIEGAGHGDIEGAGIGIYRRACADSSDAATAQRVLDTVIASVRWVGLA